jgi:hypothetical protein
MIAKRGFNGFTIVHPLKTHISFADMDRIRDWTVDVRDALLVQGRNKQWYKAEFFSYCQGL